MMNSENKITALKLAETILEMNDNREMSCNEMWNFAKKNDMLSNVTINGKTPNATFSARLYVNVKKENSIFKGIGTNPIKFILKNKPRYIEEYTDEKMLEDIYNLDNNTIEEESKIKEPVIEYETDDIDTTDYILNALYEKETKSDYISDKLIGDGIMNLRELKLEYRYRTGRNNLINDFFNPCLMNAVEYKRSAGFFSASGLISLTRGLESLLFNGGKMKLVVSPILSAEDINAIKTGYDKREMIEKSCIAQIAKINWNSGIEALAWLIANNRLDIKIALRKDLNHNGGIYHEKMGIIKDKINDYIAFSGSPNESITAHEFNFESIDVDFSWNDIRGVAKEKLDEFDELWNNATDGLEIIEFSEAAKNQLLQIRKYSNEQDFIKTCKDENIISVKLRTENKSPSIPEFINLREYQKDAIRNWFDNSCKGMFKMATGTGKTITALAATVKLIEAYKAKNKPLMIVIVCPYKHLVTQWDNECKNFNIKNIKCFDSKNKWIEHARIETMALTNIEHKYSCLITTNTSFGLPPFQSVLEKVNCDLLFIVDEAHNIGSKRQLKLLPEKANYRLALSATPERWFDEDGTKAIIDFFGKPVIEFGLKEALDNEFLTPYFYHPHLVELTEDESYAYGKISKQIGFIFQKKERTIQDKKLLEILLLKRARICASAYNKTKKLFELMKYYFYKKNILIYCGDGQVEDEFDEEESIKQTHLVIKTLGNKFDMKVHPFTAKENMTVREDIKQRFSDGELQALIAIRCLDEGVDIPAIETAFILASSTNPRQFIQRRGRVLRKSEGKEFAVIHDFIIIPPSDNYLDETSFTVERNLLKKELIRINEFAQLAKNGSQATGKMLELRKKYDLLGI